MNILIFSFVCQFLFISSSSSQQQKTNVTSSLESRIQQGGRIDKLKELNEVEETLMERSPNKKETIYAEPTPNSNNSPIQGTSQPILPSALHHGNILFHDLIVQSPTLRLLPSSTSSEQLGPSNPFSNQQSHFNNNGGYDYLVNRGHHHTRPTLSNMDPAMASTVTTPEQLLDHCCQFPACYDPLYELCIDTCRKCETAYPVTSWLPCPPLLNIPDCTSNALSAHGRLPLACYPDIGPFANVMPLQAIMKVSTFYNPSGRVKNFGVNDEFNSNTASQNEQMYRKTMQNRNKKNCSLKGICVSEKTSLKTFGSFVGRK